MKRKPFKWKKFFDSIEEAEKFVQRHEKGNINFAREFIIKLLKKYEYKFERLLDAGCGSGEICCEVAKAFPESELIGIDIGEPILELGRERASKEELSGRVRFEKDDVTRMHFEDDSFDAVISINVFHLLDEPAAMLDEIERVLKPGGILLVIAIKRTWRGYIFPIIRTAYTADEVRRVLKDSKLRNVDIKETPNTWRIMAPRLLS